jgi:hypothetical protein
MTAAVVNYVRDPSRSRRMSFDSFRRVADLSSMGTSHPSLWRLGKNPTVSFHRTSLPSGKKAYYFVWSAMEHLFVEEPGAFDLDGEDRLAGGRGLSRDPLASMFLAAHEKKGSSLKLPALRKKHVLGGLAAMAIFGAAMLYEGLTEGIEEGGEDVSDLPSTPAPGVTYARGLRTAHSQIKMSPRLISFANALRGKIPLYIISDLVINSGIRTYESQAKAMLRVLEKGGSSYFKGLYKQAAEELLALPRRDVATWAPKVADLYRRRVLNPKGHVGGGALDIGATELSLPQRLLVEELALQLGAVRVIQESQPSRHIHIEIPLETT